MKILRGSFSKYYLIKNKEYVKLFSSDVSTKSKKEKASLKKYSDTIFLPKTSFPLKSNAKFEEEIQKQLRENCDQFVIHDGPPYANGDLHLGHAVNKIAKDILGRYKVKRGAKIEFIPGWDCHGLPIELKALADESDNGNALAIRHKAFHFANKTIKKQMKTFKRWGLMADWNNPYFTYDKSYVSKQIEAFGDLYEKGYIYKAFRPVYWSPSNKTTLAEAELEYNSSHDGYSVFVKFPVENIPRELFKDNVSAVVWTTTPWTLVSNQAIAYNKHKEYCIVRCNSSKENFLMATETVERICQELKMSLEIIMRIDASLFQHLRYRSMTNPNDLLSFIDGNFVVMNKGTGLVHCAPNHGYEDYCAAINHGINMGTCVVDENGIFNKEAGHLLEGKYVLGEGSEAVLDIYSNNILQRSKYVHNYPYDWRSNKPVITLPTSQWFFDSSQVREKCVEALESIKFTPECEKQLLINQLLVKPPWCLSRQRSWGVAIPAFYKTSDQFKEYPIISRDLINHISKLINTQGIDIWWTLPKSELVPKYLREKLNLNENCDQLEKETDIFDVWFDSGLSWNNVLKDSKVADVYLEGIDQIRGWFQSSLVLSIALREKAPFKSVCMHGFVVDENGRKMSKSLGNIVNPEDVIQGKNASGADGLRWWVAHNFSHGSIAFKTTHNLKAQIDKIRNTLRFCIASLKDFDNSKTLQFSRLSVLDKYILHLLFEYCAQMEENYSKFDLKQVTRDSMSIINHISAFYFSSIKDRLYCDQNDSERRKSCQTTIFYIYQILLQNISPILPHLCEELFENQSNMSSKYSLH
ncbi:isoleucine--tRNA ligase-like protein [Leptotrombidium deliense]|uniref:isoleucine--tRNA ligase n=1 Tax=Leptotrombidium deliense TaxID=299467 RepID=A0A443SD48_9ACAR|nr:isoleucine--tRNA ligase-like protein [Leptotrombidium deliense]